MNIPAEPLTDVMQTKCRSCGGIMQYSPADEDLKCLYCGNVSELDKTPVEIRENDFLYWKEKADEEGGEEFTEAPEIRCRQCGAVTTLPPDTSGAKCAFCTTPLMMNEAEVKRFWKPEYLLPFKVTEKAGNENFRKWLGKKWFLPSELKKEKVSADRFKGVYLPFWTYDATTYTRYAGERGINRTEKSRNAKGETTNRTITDWYRASGAVTLNFDDIVVPANKTLPASIMKKLTNWDMVNCVGYRREFLAGFITEIYQRDFRESFGDAKQKMDTVIEDAIKADIGGDAQRIRSKNSEYDNLKFKLLLLPVWISAFRFNNKLYQFVINGRTGLVIGEYPKSTKKIVMLVAAIIAAIAALVMFLS